MVHLRLLGTFVASANAAQFLRALRIEQAESVNRVPLVNLTRSLDNTTNADAVELASPTLDREFDAFLEQWFQEFLERRPLDAFGFDGRLPNGCGKNSTTPPRLWGDVSSAAEAAAVEADEAKVREMQHRFANLMLRSADDERRISYRVLEEKVREMRVELEHSDFRLPFGSLGCRLGPMGCQADAARILREFPVATETDSRCFLQLLEALPEYFDAHGRRLRDAAARGVLPYRPVLEAVQADCQAMLPPDGAEADGASSDPQQNAVYKQFASRLQKATSISAPTKARLLHLADHLIPTGLWKAYRNLLATVTHMLDMDAPAADAGLVATYGEPGRAAYAARVALEAPGLSVEAVQQRALSAVAGNEEKLRQLASRGLSMVQQQAVHYAPMPDVLRRLRTRYYDDSYPDTDQGRLEYLAQMRSYVSDMWNRLDMHDSMHEAEFLTEDVPTLPCEVKGVKSKRFPVMAKFTAGSLETAPARPGSVALRVTNMTQLPKAEMQALAYHEVVPGHHLQVTRALSLRGTLPGFRRFFGDDAFGEGWAIYAEQDLARRLVNSSAASDTGFLNLMQVRAVRTVVDIGLHHQHWTREQATKFYMEHSLAEPEQVEQFVERHFLWPGQQLSYFNGYTFLKEVKEKIAKTPGMRGALKHGWEAAVNHALVSHGDIPLKLLEEILRADLDRRVKLQLEPQSRLSWEMH